MSKQLVVRLRLLTSVILFCCSTGFSQSDFKKLKSWKAKGITNITVDRIGNFFVEQANGRITKYDPDGKMTARVSKTKVTLLEPWYHPSIFIYKAPQAYSIYDRNFQNRKDYTIDPAIAIEPYLACPTHDNKLWVLDKVDWSAKKINPLTNEVIQEFSINSTTQTDFVFIREYLNLLILVDKNRGIIILNHLGKEIESISVQKPTTVHFFGEDLYYLEQDKLKFFNLTSEERFEISLPPDTHKALLTDERLLTVNSTGQITLFIYQPNQ